MAATARKKNAAASRKKPTTTTKARKPRARVQVQTKTRVRNGVRTVTKKRVAVRGSPSGPFYSKSVTTTSRSVSKQKAPRSRRRSPPPRFMREMIAHMKMFNRHF